MDESKQRTSRQPATLGSTAYKAPRPDRGLEPKPRPESRFAMTELSAKKQPPMKPEQPGRVLETQGSTRDPKGHPQGTPKLMQDTRQAVLPRTLPAVHEQRQQTSSTSQDSSSGLSGASFSFRRNHHYGDVASSSEFSTESTTTTTSSGHCCVCNVASDSEMAPRARRRRAGNREPAEGRFAWATFLSIAALAVFALFLLLFSAVAVIETHQMVMRLTPRPEVSSQHKAESVAPKRTSAPPLEQTRELFELETSSAPTLTTPNAATSREVNMLTNKTTTGKPALSTFVGSTSRARKTTRSRRVSKDRKRASVQKTRSRSVSPATVPRSKGVDLGVDGEDKSAAFPFRHPTPPACGNVLYTFCRRAGTEFHFSPSSNSCVGATHKALHTCNQGPNRFASLSQCLERCVSAEHPADECFDQPLFTSCTSQDTVSTWWYPQGNTCMAWKFPSDGCPANGSAVFATADECTRRCIQGRHQKPPCQPPRAVPCALGHLKYPFFAHLSAEDGRIRCLQASDAVLRGYQCLVGANRYRSLDDCNAACKPHHNVAPHTRR